MILIKNKKGILDDWGDFFFSTIIFVVVFVFLIIADNASMEAFKIQANDDINRLNAQQDLISFLRSPVEYNSETISISDLMVLHTKERDNSIQLKTIEKKAKEFFREDAFVRFAGNYGIEVCKPGDEDCEELAAAYLPDYNKIGSVRVSYKGPK